MSAQEKDPQLSTVHTASALAVVTLFKKQAQGQNLSD